MDQLYYVYPHETFVNMLIDYNIIDPSIEVILNPNSINISLNLYITSSMDQLYYNQ